MEPPGLIRPPEQAPPSVRERDPVLPNGLSMLTVRTPGETASLLRAAAGWPYNRGAVATAGDQQWKETRVSMSNAGVSK